MTSAEYTDANVAAGVTLGSELRAARLGFRWFADVMRYLRIEVSEEEVIFDRVTLSRKRVGNDLYVDLVGPSALPNRPSPSGTYAAWWEVWPDLGVAAEAALLNLCETMVAEGFTRAHIDDAGKILEGWT